MPLNDCLQIPVTFRKKPTPSPFTLFYSQKRIQIIDGQTRNASFGDLLVAIVNQDRKIDDETSPATERASVRA